MIQACLADVVAVHLDADPDREIVGIVGIAEIVEVEGDGVGLVIAGGAGHAVVEADQRITNAVDLGNVDDHQKKQLWFLPK